MEKNDILFVLNQGELDEEWWLGILNDSSFLAVHKKDPACCVWDWSVGAEILFSFSIRISSEWDGKKKTLSKKKKKKKCREMNVAEVP